MSRSAFQHPAEVMRLVASVVAISVSALALSAQVPERPQTPVFRAAVDTVVVDVVVRDGGRAVTGLRIEDFRLTDNGVQQRVESVDAISVPIDLTMIVDLSGNPRSPWQDAPSVATRIGELEQEVQDVARSLRPEDRVRILGIDRQVVHVAPFRPASSAARIPNLQVDGLPALFDTLATALIHGTEPARRHVVIARTKGFDGISAVDAAAVKALAERSDALLHIAVMESALDNEQALSAFQCQFMGLCWATRSFWVPHWRPLVGGLPLHALLPDGEVVASGAEATGGGLHQASGLTVPSLTGLFRKTIEEYRNSYVLRYTPQGVPMEGWHAIDVRIQGSKSYRIRARPGYFVETATKPVPPPVPAGLARTFGDLTAAFGRGEYTQVVTAVRAAKDPLVWLREFEDAGNPWPASPRREAAFALDLVEPALFSSDGGTRDAATTTLDRSSRLIRHPLGPDSFERYWYFAALTMLEGTLRPRLTEGFVRRARKRFPEEPRFLLSEAIAMDQRWTSRVVGGRGHPSSEQVESIRKLYGAAIGHRETAVEARIRLAFFLHRIGSNDEALTLLTGGAGQSTTDAWSDYLQELCRGHVLSALARPDEAVTAFRAAVKVIPSALAGRVALMNALVLSGARTEAEALAEQIQRQASAAIDPWAMYWQGQYRFHQQAMSRVRELAQ
jgi:VWFA-related protein